MITMAVQTILIFLIVAFTVGLMVGVSISRPIR